jgi:3-oxoacyl-[acyl-carrier-protein] synthase III
MDPLNPNFNLEESGRFSQGKVGVRKDVNLSGLTFEAARPALYDALIILKKIDFVSFA